MLDELLCQVVSLVDTKDELLLAPFCLSLCFFFFDLLGLCRLLFAIFFIAVIIFIFVRVIRLLCSSILLRDILFKVFGVEKVWVPCIHYLEKEVGLLDDPPELPPNFDILLEWRNSQFDVAFLDRGQIAPPLQKRQTLLLVNLLSRHALLPSGPSRDFQWPVLRVVDVLVGQEFVDHG